MTKIRQAIGAFWRLMARHPRLSAGGGAVAVGAAVSLIAMLASSAAPAKPPPLILVLPPSKPMPLPVMQDATGLYSPFTGEPVKEGALAGGMKRSRWVSKAPLAVAGVNLGTYVSRERDAGSTLRLGSGSVTKIEVYATRVAESALERRRNERLVDRGEFLHAEATEWG